jgi:hypothetical protein
VTTIGMPKEPFVLADVPALLSPSRRPLRDLRNPLPVVTPPGFDVHHLVFAEHVGVHQPVKLVLLALTTSGTIVDADLTSILAPCLGQNYSEPACVPRAPPVRSWGGQRPLGA